MNQKILTSEQVLSVPEIARLSGLLAHEARRAFVDRAWLFGSYARGEQTEKSDIDILIAKKAGVKCSLLDLAGLEIELAEKLRRPIHLLTEREIHPSAQTSVEKERILIHEAA